jgi:hypothetical protein
MRATLFALVLIFAAPAIAQESQTQTESACVAIDNDAERLACYDRANGRIPRAAPDLPTPNLPTPGERDRLLPSFPNLFQGDREEAPAPILHMQIVRVERRVGGQTMLVMDNGETWSPAGNPERLPRAGESVSIQRYAIGAYVLLPEHGEPFRVRKQN